MATTKILLGIICLVTIGSSYERDGNLLKYWAGHLYTERIKRIMSGPIPKTYKKLIPIAQAELWVREETGNNDGKRVEEYQATVGLKKGDPYCAAFISWVFKQAGYSAPRTGWSPSLFPVAKLVKAAAPGNVFGIYFPSLKRIAHCGFVEHIKGDWISTIEGNTNVSGSRECDGVHRRLRHKKTIYTYSDWRLK